MVQKSIKNLIIFSSFFWPLLAPILGKFWYQNRPKLVPNPEPKRTSTQKHLTCRNAIKTNSFLMIFEIGASAMRTKINQKSIKKLGQQGKASWHRFLSDFGGFWEASWGRKSSKNRLKKASKKRWKKEGRQDGKKVATRGPDHPGPPAPSGVETRRVEKKRVIRRLPQAKPPQSRALVGFNF